MPAIVEPTRAQLDRLVAPYLETQPSGLGFAIGYASPRLPNAGGLYFAGNIQSQFGSTLRLDGATRFEIASIAKTFTSTLYALLIRAADANRTVGDYGVLTSPALAGIRLDDLVNYTSGLPPDNDDDGASAVTPPYWPQPYSMPGMLSFLNTATPRVSQSGRVYSYSNLAFAMMAAIIASGGSNGDPAAATFVKKMREHVFEPLGLGATYFDEASLATLPLGQTYTYRRSNLYEAAAPGHPLYPAYFGAHGIVATPNDMFRWLLFNMGIEQNRHLTPLLPALQLPSTPVVERDGDNRYQLGLGWFIEPADPYGPGSIFKDGELDGFASYMAFLPSADPGAVPSQAGAFVLVNADGITYQQTKDGEDIAAALTSDLLLIMQGKDPGDASV